MPHSASLVELSYAVASVLLLVSELAFLGLFLGTPEVGLTPVGLAGEPQFPEWGAMLGFGLRLRGQGWWLLLVPTLALGYAICAFTLLAEGLRRR